MKRITLSITLALLAATTMAGNLWVIGTNGAYTGTRYNTDESRFHAFHAGQGEKCVWLETAPEIIGTNTVGRIKRLVYRAATSNEAAAAEAAAEAPLTQDRSIQFLGNAGPAVRGSDGKWYQPVPDPKAGDWLAVPRTGSPWHRDARFSNDVAVAVAERQSIVDLLKNLKPTMTNAIAGAKASKVAWQANKADWQNVTNAVWTGAQRTEAGKMKAAGIAAANAGIDAANASIDTARALNNLRVRLLKFYKVEEQEVE